MLSMGVICLDGFSRRFRGGNMSYQVVAFNTNLSLYCLRCALVLCEQQEMLRSRLNPNFSWI